MVAIGQGPNRELIVIGTSAGGVEALPRLLAQLPAELPAAICVVQHITTGSALDEILQRACGLTVQWGEHGDTLQHGNVYIAPVGVHMLVDASGQIVLAGGPRENRSRPAINRLFRSAAAYHGSRTIGVLLTGMLDDGVAGLVAIKKAGGLVVVQDPDDAAFPDMPRNALARAPVDRVLPLDGLGAELVLLCGQPAREVWVPAELLLEAQIDAEGPAEPTTVGQPRAPIAGPECRGPSLLLGKATEVEQSLWAAVRSLEEHATLLTRLAADASLLGGDAAANDYEKRAREAHDHAERARRFLLDLQRLQIEA